MDLGFRRFIWIVLALCVVLVVVGCGTGAVRREVEKSVAASLPELIGPADSYTVSAHGSTLDMLKGKVDRLDIVGNNVRLKRGPVVERLVVNVRDISFDTGSKKIRRVGGTQYSAAITDEALTEYLTAKYPDIDGLNVELGSGEVKLTAKPGVSVVSTRVQATARVEVRQERILALDLETLKVAGISAPGIARDLIDSRLGTIFDARDMGYDARIKTATITPGLLTIAGSLDLMKTGPE